MIGDDAVNRLVSATALLNFVASRRKALRLCMANNLPGEVLVLAYVTMDNFASLDRAAGHATTSGDDFVRWVETYMLPGSGLSVSALDLWAARCGLVHDYSPESNLIRKGEASEIAYVWGKRTEEDLRKLIEDTYAREAPDQPRPKAVHLERLLSALSEGVQRFLRDVRADPAREQEVLARARQLIALMPGSEWGSDSK